MQLFEELEIYRDMQDVDWAQVRQLVQECPDVIKERNNDGSLPLHLALSALAPLNVIRG